ncbi:MAG: FIST C-terminal domain-containing protein [Candidatus Sungbacteria bacterium]|uniref:FIST C-terminal domain-containing protein n=1 Tax=Candidatus Sungiibacteriota bacterium TaxID=2750080 RepID=A0A932QXR4_9BACT|nr:FIST C-terminal domain-containing protein [Candidatus Sungbacteria bacterium]
MSIIVGVGSSREKDSYQAGYEACKKALEGLHGQKPDLTIAFASSSFDQKELVRGIRQTNGTTPLVGCTSAGEITNEGPVQKSVGVMTIASDQISFTTGLAKITGANAHQAGQAVAGEIKAKAPEPFSTLIMLPDVLTGNGADSVRGILEILGAHFPVVGGAPGDDFLFEKTYEYRDDTVETGAIAGIGISGKFSMGVGVRHGWIPIGMPMQVTKSKGAVVYELDHRPAISLYEDYFGQKAEELRKEPLAQMAITYPLGIKVPDIDEYLIRDPITVDEKGAITCAAEIPEGSEVRLMIGSKDKAIEAAQDAARKLMKDFEAAGSKPKFTLMFNCIAREKLFSQQAGDEIRAVMDIIGKDVPLLGFYTYGEQAPMRGEIRDTEKINTRFYNETVVLFAVGE